MKSCQIWKIFQRFNERIEPITNSVTVVSGLVNLERSVPGGEDVDENDIWLWLNCDVNELTFEHLNDEDIINRKRTYCAPEDDTRNSALTHQ